MKIIPFEKEHASEASTLAYTAYKRSCETISCLPLLPDIPSLYEFAGNGAGVAAVDDGQLLGFLCAYPPFDDAFGIAGVRGVYVPPHAHGTVTENSGVIYTRLYEAAARCWAEAGAVSHAITLYTHDKPTVDLFFKTGFGLRCVDAVRNIAVVPFDPLEGCTFLELDKTEAVALFPLLSALNDHLKQSPIFLDFGVMPTEACFAAVIRQQDARYFAVRHMNRYVAYMKIGHDGENFISNNPIMLNIRGAYCLPEYRGTGLYRALLAYVNNILHTEGIGYLGVDYESYNPPARGFWEKHFTPYTYTVVRRIDHTI